MALGRPQARWVRTCSESAGLQEMASCAVQQSLSNAAEVNRETHAAQGAKRCRPAELIVNRHVPSIRQRTAAVLFHFPRATNTASSQVWRAIPAKNNGCAPCRRKPRAASTTPSSRQDGMPDMRSSTDALEHTTAMRTHAAKHRGARPAWESSRLGIDRETILQPLGHTHTHKCEHEQAYTNAHNRI